MKILVSSKRFSECFKKFKHEHIRVVEIKDNVFTAHTIDDEISIDVETKDNGVVVDQYTARWDWFLRDLSKIGEQPIVLEFSKNRVNFTLMY